MRAARPRWKADVFPPHLAVGAGTGRSAGFTPSAPPLLLLAATLDAAKQLAALGLADTLAGEGDTL
ncbi:hypothetical protein ACS0VI_29515 [Streptomyces sp. H28]|uniref:hypothetical protein n=1 Tax=unclassified Streptomyces TaxID=2593676 RepID=UPI001CE12113|nr:hypothetical protein [Streptomyces sp. H28]